MAVIIVFALVFMAPHLGMVPEEITEEQAVEIGRSFLEDENYVVGEVLFAELEERTPNLYGHGDNNLSDPREEKVLCWVIRFEHVLPNGYFTV
ncbi:MAG: hypothetical protein NWF04_04120 [Candidatus Bathyarchaeota archaeon]|nr:hypothetical protein [Candidatus Bathyarchaeota archaeon]